MDTRKDLKISTCGLPEAVLDAAVALEEMEGVAEGVGRRVVEEDGLEFREPAESGGSG